MLKQIALVFGLVIGVSVYFQFSTTKGRIVETNSGSVQGIVSSSRDGRKFDEWLGIPYAKPPVGNLRFASPVPVDKWNGVRDGSKYGYRCVQMEFFSLFIFGKEDCLTLSVHAPQHDSNKLLPVMLYIHGGGFAAMASDDYRPGFFMDEDIILVVINYRLGLFGFMNTGDELIRGNMGLKDQALAIKWTKNNIKYFGGNPDQITIFGESAGGASVHYQLLSPMTKGLFQRAISQSGVAINPWAIYSTDAAKNHTMQLAKKVKCTAKDSKKLVECLRRRSSVQLMAAHTDDVLTVSVFYPHKSGTLFRPSVEAVNDSETFIAQHPLGIVENGLAHKVPWMAGVTADEGLLASAGYYSSPEWIDSYESEWEQNTLRAFGITSEHPNATEISNRIRQLYFPPNITDVPAKLPQFTKMLSDSLFNFPMHHMISKQKKFSPVYPYVLSRQGGFSLSFIYLSAQQLSNRSVRMKFVTFVEKLIRNGFKEIVLGRPRPVDGVAHGDDIILMFPLPLVFELSKDKTGDLQFSKDLIKLWVSFAKNESMSFRGVAFPPISSDSDGPLKYMDLTESPAMIDEPFLGRMTHLDSLQMLNQY
ncbi:unnamed protein product [Allacma fusca]|uniref:Carboxylic ester hydrolase n=1 Tax=Allacma fusca TaxID=39272 RepID=A0A8J2P7S1_9HEXA|nr:unnamed protein product [Allacma fusca]